MLISQKHKFIFIHIPKTGGTSVKHALGKYSDRIPGLTDTAENTIKYGHIKACDLRKRVPPEIWNNSFKFVFVRNPWDWLVSLYHFERESKKHCSHRRTVNMSFSEYLDEWNASGRPVFQKDWLTDSNGKLVVDFVGRFENLEKDFSYICSKLGLRRKLPHRLPSEHLHYAKYYDEKTEKAVRRKFEEDIKFFEYSLKKRPPLGKHFKRSLNRITVRIAVRTRLKQFVHKLNFLYRYYIGLPLKREVGLLVTAGKVQKTINKLKKSKNIPRISRNFTAKHDINIHILSSHRHLESLLLSLVSFYAFSKEYAGVTIHEDGTFTKKDVSIIRKIFPWAKQVSLSDADKILKQKGFSDKTIKLRHKHKLLIKALDFHHIESKERILIMDTDVFALGGMQEAWEAIAEGAQFIYNSDPEPAYGSSKELLEKVLNRSLNINLRPCVNTGLIIEPAAVLKKNKNTAESYCDEFNNFPYKRIHCVEQGYIACVLKDKKIAEHPLSDRFKIVSSRNADNIEWLKKYDFENNPENLESIHLCGWDRLGKDFQAIKRKLFLAVCRKVK